jgi:hypothetical protein
MKNKFIVDTNVLIVANEDINCADEDALECIEACCNEIENIYRDGKLVLDIDGEIENEYRKHLRSDGSPGLGDSFYKWIHDYGYNSQYCLRLKINKTGDSYREFPQDESLNTFDLSDRKFVALACAANKEPIILEAKDCKWLNFKEIFSHLQIKVKFINENYLRKIYRNKFGCEPE